MQYYFDDFVLSIKTAELFNAEKSISIDPKVYDLLLFFCQNTQRVISREELLSQIWPTTIVSDNTLNRLIASLRKSLGDNAKSPRFIQTVPKLGYRFICDVKAEVAQSRANSTPVLQQKYNFSMRLFYLTLLLVVSLVTLYLWPASEQQKVASQDIETLTRISGDKFSPVVSKSGQTLVFVGRKDGIDTLWRKSLTTTSLLAIHHHFDRIFKIVRWADNGEIVLLVREQGIKKLIRGQVIDDTVEILGQAAINIDQWHVIDIEQLVDNQFVMIAKSPQHVSAQLYQFDFFASDIEHLNIEMAPKSNMMRLDVNQQGNRVLLLIRNVNNSTSLYQLNTDNWAMRHYHTFDGIIRNAMWQHDGAGIYVTAMPPAQKVLALDGPDDVSPKVVASSSEYLCCDMALIPNEHDIVYRTNIRNYDLKWLRGGTNFISNSTIYDMLPVLFNHSSGLAFISKREGAAQVYLQREGREAYALSSFEQYKVFTNIAINNDDEYLVTAEANRLHVFDLSHRALLFSQEFPERISHVSWLNNDVMAVVTNDQQRKSIVLINVKAETIKHLNSQWQRILIDKINPQQAYLVDHNNALYTASVDSILGGEMLPRFASQLAIAVNRDTIIDNGKLYYIPHYDRHLQVSQISAPNLLIEEIDIGASYGFDVNGRSIVISYLANSSTELHRTK